MSSNSRGSLVVSMLLVAILSLASILLLLCSFVIWFSTIVGSITLSLFITGVVLGIAAWVTYKLRLSATLKIIRDEYERTIAIVTLMKYAYDVALKRIQQLLTFLQ